jgi:hypothetical protein
MAQQELPDGRTPTISRDAARHRLYEHLCALHSCVLTDGRTILTIVDDQTVDVGDGWVFTYRIHSRDETIGAGRYVVHNGTMTAFGSIPSVEIQLAIYRAMHTPGLDLPWPRLMSISLHLKHHFVINVVPATTLCDEPLPQHVQPRGIADPPFDEDVCWACMVALRSSGPFCTTCGNRLRSNEHTLCGMCEGGPASD